MPIPTEEAFQDLRKNPELASQFKEYYGFLPAPSAAVEDLDFNPGRAPEFKQHYGYLPAPQKAIEELKTNPALSQDFLDYFGYLPDTSKPTWGERGEAGLRDVTAAGIRLARLIPTLTIESASRAQKKSLSSYDQDPSLLWRGQRAEQRPLRGAEGIVGYQPPILQDEYSDIERVLPEEILPDVKRSAEEVSRTMDGTIAEIEKNLPDAIKAARSGPLVTKDKDGKLDVHWDNVNFDVLSKLAAESITFAGGVLKLAKPLGGGAIAAGSANSILISADVVHDTRQMIMAKLEKRGIRGEEAEVLANMATDRALGIIGPTAFVAGKFGEGAAVNVRTLRQAASATGKSALGETGEEVVTAATPAIATGEKPKSEEMLAAAILAPAAGTVQGGTISAAAAWDNSRKEKLAKDAVGAVGKVLKSSNDQAQGKDVQPDPDATREFEGEIQESDLDVLMADQSTPGAFFQQDGDGSDGGGTASVERRSPENAEQRQRVETLARRVAAAQDDIKAGRADPAVLGPLVEELYQATYTDPLVGLRNYRSFKEFVAENPNHAVMLMDLDDFRGLNDKYGHAGADQVLKKVGEVMRQVGEEMNVVPFRRAHQGAGDEFLAVSADPGLLKTYAKRVQEVLDSTTLNVTNKRGEQVTHQGIGSSHGVATDETTVEPLLQADKDARKAAGKRQGLRDKPGAAVQDQDAANMAAPTGVPAGESAGGGVDTGGTEAGKGSADRGRQAEGNPVTSEQIQAARPDLPAEERPSSTAYAGVALDRMGELLVNATHKLMDKLGIAREGVEVVKSDPETRPGPMSLIWSPSKLVKKYPKLAKYVTWARELAFEIQEGLRNAFRHRLDKVDEVLAEGDIFGRMSDVYRQNKRTLREIRLTEDVLGKWLTAQQMKDDFGASPAVIKARMLLRSAYDHAWKILSKTKELRGKMPPGYVEGYLPHMFHNFFVIHENPLPPGAMGPSHSEIVGSGRTMAEAIAIANQLRRLGGKGPIKIKQKQFEFPGEGLQSAVVGDIEYFQMQRKLENDFTFTLDEAQEIMEAMVRRKGRTRFFGNLMERKGAPGWEQDLDWVDRRYFNMVARYAALDRFKKKAIDAYERDGFGKFDQGDKKGLAQYVKDYINDVNGTPTYIEDMLNNGIADTWMGKFLGHYLGDRPILQLANGSANAIAIAKLGFLSPAAALINASQLIGAYALLGEKHFMLGNGLTIKAISGKGKGASTLRGILKQAGVDIDLGLESAAGYSSNAPLGKALNMTMIGFTSMEKYVRATTVLGAYHKARAGGASHKEAIDFAKGINRRVNFDYSIVDTPNFIRRSGPLGTVLFQFKKFPVKSLELMLSLKGAEHARYWIPVFLIAGMYAFPGGEALKELIKASTSRNGYGGWDAELELKKWLTNWAGNDPDKQRWAKVVMYGAFSLEPIGVDISKRVGGFDFIPSRPSDLLGPGVSSIWRAWQFGTQGEWAEALRAVTTSPGNVAVALSQDKFSRSVADRDRPIAEVTPGDVVKKAIGFRPYEEAKEVDISRLINYENERYRHLQMEVVDGIIASVLRYNETLEAISQTAPAHDQPALMKDIKGEYDREIADIMKTIAKNGLIITPDQMLNEIKNKNLTRSQRAFLNSSDVIKARSSRIYMFSQGSPPVRQGSGNAEE